MNSNRQTTRKLANEEVENVGKKRRKSRQEIKHGKEEGKKHRQVEAKRRR